jgi:hypothetical protein
VRTQRTDHKIDDVLRRSGSSHNGRDKRPGQYRTEKQVENVVGIDVGIDAPGPSCFEDGSKVRPRGNA